ncbi:BA14K family protein [Novosphingobium sp. BL-8A]|uniref:BA14K family protein n=1 Tax=Novosphingobium sp. BL-8A TaxID=3127639 RepID=UPI0037568438
MRLLIAVAAASLAVVGVAQAQPGPNGPPHRTHPMPAPHHNPPHSTHMSAHAKSCAHRYRSYNPHTNKYRTHDGHWRTCR